MKKRIIASLCLGLAIVLNGCGNDSPSGRSFDQSSNVKDVLEAGMSENAVKDSETPVDPETPVDSETPADSETQAESRTSGESETQVPSDISKDVDETEILDISKNIDAKEDVTVSADSDVSEAAAASEGIDVDLTQLSSTMVYSEVFTIMMKPESYIGKTMKMRGLYSYFHDAMTDKDYSACVIQDATACCAQGIEFVLTDDYKYPEDYPEIDEEITVTGVFDSYQEGEYTFYTLKNARLL